jgi:hypothetical protein
MTFCEDDMLPYSDIKREWTAESMKTTLMQWTMLQPKILELDGCIKSSQVESFSDLTSLDMDVKDGFPYVPASFPAAFDQTLTENERDAAKLKKRSLYLQRIVLKLQEDSPKSKAMLDEVVKLLLGELRDANVPGERNWVKPSCNLRTKVCGT